MAGKGISTTSEPLEFDEYLRLIKYLEKDKKYLWATFCVIGCSFALRASDTLNMKWGDVIGGDICYIKEQKTQKTKRVEINPSVSKKIKLLYEKLGHPDLNQLIFLSKRTGRPYTIQTVNYHLRNFKKKYLLSVDHFSSHSIRKTFGKKVFKDHKETEKGLLIAGDAYNHSNPSTTKAYIGITRKEYESAYNAIQF